ncbi:gas vesicle protein GvpO [Nocardia sp. CDC153]|uniref:gas vesicle protein GvpO n=1 Tax=Nocardia sp. CDC153 TaxID=3112167 RepID=UPI002DB99B3E|nr:gas vesicle protein GvpO [Nocardia sp. CDC153]MEC3957459.1 gas vesicle protein GvpO [Nocardia sp. CDC153]
MADEQRSRARSSGSKGSDAAKENGRLSAADAATVGVRLIAQLTGQSVLGATASRPAEHGWTVEVEVLEETHIPSSADVLALYRLDLSETGDLLSYSRIRRGQRCSIGDDRR